MRWIERMLGRVFITIAYHSRQTDPTIAGAGPLIKGSDICSPMTGGELKADKKLQSALPCGSHVYLLRVHRLHGRGRYICHCSHCREHRQSLRRVRQPVFPDEVLDGYSSSRREVARVGGALKCEVRVVGCLDGDVRQVRGFGE
jgi:hypothetical protein